jgi:hypothetical protein
MHASELKNEQLRGLLRAEGAALEGARGLKREAEQHMRQALEACKG